MREEEAMTPRRRAVKARTLYPRWRCLKMHKPMMGATVRIMVELMTYADLPGCICKNCVESFREWILLPRRKREGNK